MENEFLNLKYLNDLISSHNVKDLRAIFETYEIIDIAEIINKFEDPKDLLFIFKTVKAEYTSELFTYLDDDIQEKLINLFNDKQLMELIANSYTDDIVDFLTDMPANLVTRILAISDKDTRQDINQLLNYKEETAGAIMTTEYVLLNNRMTVKDALTRIREIGRDKETIYTSFIVDEKRFLIGVIDISELIYADENAFIKDLMEKDFIYTTVNTDQEEVARLVQRYDLSIIPVLNEEKRLIGIITFDDIFDVIQKEASEDILHLAGLSPFEESYMKSTSWLLAKKSIPWLLILLVLGALSSMILNRFEHAFEQVIILSAFVPVLMDAGGNAGSQSSTFVIRSLALKEVDVKDFLKVLWKEFKVSVLVGLAVAIFSFFWVHFEFVTGILVYHNDLPKWSLSWFLANSQIAGLISLTLFFAILIAKITGGLLPLIAVAFKQDPAVMAGPLITTVVDITALLTYFYLSSALFNLVIH